MERLIDTMHSGDESKFMRNVNKSEVPDACWLWNKSVTKDGYGTFSWKGQTVSAHRYAYSAFVAPLEPGMRITHTCMNKLCMNPDHLVVESTDPKRLRMWKTAMAQIKSGEKASQAKLTEVDVRRIHRLYHDGKTLTAIATEFKVSIPTITSIRDNISWRHLGLVFEKKKRDLRGVLHPNSKLSEETVRKIKKYLRLGKTPLQISDMLRVDRTLIYAIRSGRVWKHIVE